MPGKTSFSHENDKDVKTCFYLWHSWLTSMHCNWNKEQNKNINHQDITIIQHETFPKTTMNSKQENV